jgi:hypothetical protein
MDGGWREPNGSHREEHRCCCAPAQRSAVTWASAQDLLTRMLHQVDGVIADIATVQAHIDARIGELAPTVVSSMRSPGSGRWPRR